MRRASLEDPRYFLNRHLSWLQFNRRVLEEASDSSNPLLERVKFLAITANNFGDQFGPLSMALLNLGKNCMSLIERETAYARAGQPAFVVAKGWGAGNNQINTYIVSSDMAG